MPLRGDARKRSTRGQPRDGRASAVHGAVADGTPGPASAAASGTADRADRKGTTTLLIVLATFGILWWLGRRGLASPRQPVATRGPAADAGTPGGRPHPAPGATLERDLPALPGGRADGVASPLGSPATRATDGPVTGPTTDRPAGHVSPSADEAAATDDSSARDVSAASGGAVPAASPYGPGSAEPLPDGSAPPGFAIKGNGTSKVYHAPESPYYARSRADVWFQSMDAAEAAGFRHWNSRRKKT